MAEALGETDGVAVPVGVALALTVGAGDGTATLPGRTTSTARSTAATAAIRAPRRTGRFRVIWWAERESNPHSTKAADLQSAELTTCSICPSEHHSKGTHGRPHAPRLDHRHRSHHVALDGRAALRARLARS